MIERIRQILLSFIRERTFSLSCFVVLALLIFKPDASFREMLLHFPAELSWRGGFLIVAGLWMLFLFGTLLKFQFAQFRSHLVPYFRSTHMAVFVGIGLAMTLLGFFWLDRISQTLTMRYILLSGILFGLITIILAYMSYVPIVIAVGFLWVVFISDVFIWSQTNFGWGMTLAINSFLVFGAALFLIWRFAVLREESFEYPYLLWSFEKLGSAKRGGLISLCRLTQPIRERLFLSKNGVDIKTFQSIPDIFSQALYLDAGRMKMVVILFFLFLALAPLYAFELDPIKAVLQAHQKYFFLIAFPAVLTIIFNEHLLIVRNSEWLRPISVGAWIKARVLLLHVEAIYYWASILFILVILPQIVFLQRISADQVLSAPTLLTGLLTVSFLGMGFLSKTLNGWVGAVLLAVMVAGALFSFSILETQNMLFIFAAWTVAWIVIWGLLVKQWLNRE